MNKLLKVPREIGKLRLFLFIILLPTVLWAQENFNLPIVPPEESVPAVKPEASAISPLVLPEVPSGQGMASLTRPEVPSFSPLTLPRAESQIFEFGTHQFGGLNLFSPVNRLSKEQSLKCLNLIPEGFSALAKRSGYEKINFTAIDGVYGGTIAQSTIPQILVSCADSLRYADSTTSWEFSAIDTTEAVLTYFASTPFGVVIMNGEDSTRIWDGSAIEALGLVDTGTFTADTTDTEKAWTADEWIGFYVKCGTGCTSMFEILDNGANWLSLVTGISDTCAAESSYQILARPDSSATTLTYPEGKAGAYFQDRLFINSDKWRWRIYFSGNRDPDNIAPDSFINLDMGKHDEIVWMGVFNGYLIVFGKYSIYGINTSFVATPITKSLGCVAPYTIAVGDDYVYFLSERGVYRFNSNIYASMSYKPEKISTPVEDIIDGIDPRNVDYCGGLYLNRQYWLSYHPDSCIVFDERTEQWYGPQTFGFSSALNYSSVFGKAWGEYLYPNADADTSDWTVSTGSDSHYYYIYSADSLSDYLYTSTSGVKDFFEFDNTTRFPTGGIVDYITIYLIAKRASPPYGYLRIYLDVVANGQRYELGNFYPLAYTWYTHQMIVEANPITSSAWTKDDLDSLKLGIRCYHSVGPLHNMYVGALWVVPRYEGDLTLSSFLFGAPTKSFVYKYGGIAVDDTSDTAVDVSGQHITATYQSGWFDNDLPTDDKLMRQFYLQTESDSGDIWVYYYVDYGTTPSDSDLVHLGDKRTSWWMLGEKVKGKNFSIEIENKSNVDSLTIKGWSALIRNLGARGGE